MTVTSHNYTFTLPNGNEKKIPATISSLFLIQEAETLGIGVEIIPDTNLIEFSYKNTKQLIRAQVPPLTTYVAHYATEDKGLTKVLLSRAGINTPRGFTLRTFDEDVISEVLEELTLPVVIKPAHGVQGGSVFMNITSVVEAIDAVRACFAVEYGDLPGVVIEEMFEGTEYRITATPHEVLAVTKRIPANVTGDGTHSIAELIEQKNSDPRRGSDATSTLKNLSLDANILENLTKIDLTPDSIPESGERVYLRSNSNISTGGDSIDYTDRIHPSVQEIALAAMNAIPGLAFAGIDFVTTDVTSEQSKDTYTIIELNKSPGFFIHEAPFKGKSRPVARELLFMMFPELAADFRTGETAA